MSKDITLLEEVSEQALEVPNGGIFVPEPPITVTDKITGVELCGLIHKMPSSRAQKLL